MFVLNVDRDRCITIFRHDLQLFKARQNKDIEKLWVNWILVLHGSFMRSTEDNSSFFFSSFHTGPVHYGTN